jgi:hypothetical protein
MIALIMLATILNLSGTPSPTPTGLPSTPILSLTPTDTVLAKAVLTPTPTADPVPTITPTLTQTITPSQSPSPTLDPTPSVSVVPTVVPSQITPTPTLGPTLTGTPANTITPTPTSAPATPTPDQVTPTPTSAPVTNMATPSPQPIIPILNIQAPPPIPTPAKTFNLGQIAVHPLTFLARPEDQNFYKNEGIDAKEAKVLYIMSVSLGVIGLLLINSQRWQLGWRKTALNYKDFSYE